MKNDVDANNKRLEQINLELLKINAELSALVPEKYAFEKEFKPKKHALPSVDTQKLRELFEKKTSLEEERLKNPDFKDQPRGHKPGFSLSPKTPQWSASQEKENNVK